MNLNYKIKKFYDDSTPLWLDIWGEHMHHGFYGNDGLTKKDKIVAQIDMIEALLKWGGVSKVSSVLDAGCGVGGSARYLAQKYNATALGLTLSAVQSDEAKRYTSKAGLSNQVKFAVRDIMTLNDTDGPFDLIWSMESAEHIEEKYRMLDLFYQSLMNNGRLVMATWCIRDAPPVLNYSEKKLLQKIYGIYHLPPMVSISELESMAIRIGYKGIKTDDWSTAIAPFWKTVIETALTWRGIKGIIKSGVSTAKGAWAMRYMQKGFKIGLIKFGVVSGYKS